MRATLALVLPAAAALAGCSSAPVPPPSGRAPGPPYWHVEDGFLRDADGRAAILRGFNVTGEHKWAPYFDYQQPPDYARIRTDWGMSSIRFLVIWAALEPERGVYDDAYLDEVERRVRWAADAGLDVVIDMHQDIYGEGFPGGDGAPRWTCDQQHYDAFVPVSPWFLSYLDENVIACYDGFWQSDDLRGHYVEAWRRVASRLAGVPAVVGFDPMNEPFWGSYDLFAFEHDRLQPFYLDVVRAVRAEAPEWVAFLEPGSSRNIGFATGLEPFGVPHVVYSPHSYDRDAEGGSGFDEGRRDAVLLNMAALADEAKALGAALWIGEFGGRASAPGIGAYMDAEVDAATTAMAGMSYWHYGKDDGYGFLDPDGNEKPELAAELVRPAPHRIGGVPRGWSWDGAARELVFEMTSAEGDPTTTLRVPPRVYPEGAAVDCTGCTASAVVDGELEIAATRAGEVRVVLRPAL